MKAMKNLVTMGALVCAVLVSSCSVNDDIEDNNNNGAVRFTAGIGEVATPQNAPGTRAAGTVWGNDAIGVFMMSGSTSIADNKQYTTTGDGTFTAVSGDEMYYPMNGSTVDFIAYYPYESGAVLGTPIDVTIGTTQTAASQATFDLLYSNDGSGSKSNGTNPVVLTFDHKLAKIVMNCKGDASVGTLPGTMTVSINDMNTENTFNLATGTLGSTPGTAADITPNKIATANTFDASYDAIIMPGSYLADVVTVVFTVNGEPFTWTLPATDFAGGNEYTYAVTLSRTGVKVTGTINSWTPVTGGGVTAD